MNTDTRTRTIKEWAHSEGFNPDNARRTVSRKAGRTLGQMSVLTPDEWEAWKPGKSGQVSGQEKEKKKVKVKSVFSPAPAVQNVVPSEPIGEGGGLDVPTLATVRAFLLDALLIGIVVGHAGLIWYDCAAMWSEPGQIGGGLAFGIILAAVMLATDSSKNITSQWALILALLVDVGAYWVHFPTFQTYSVPDAITSVLCVFLCTMSFGALFLYRHLKNN